MGVYNVYTLFAVNVPIIRMVYERRNFIGRDVNFRTERTRVHGES